jgi:hypothetical protein
MNEITQAIRNLVDGLPTDINEKWDNFQLFSAGKILLELNDESIKLCGTDITHKIMAEKDKYNKAILKEEWLNFLGELGGSYVQLNHLGISYACKDLDREVSYYKNLVSAWGLNLYEESSDDLNARWLFVGDITDLQTQLFEIVLTKDQTNPENNWRPHFQIDIDTDLDEESLDKLLTKYFGPKFIQWKLSFPNYGTVLSMGMLGCVKGTKIYLGTGTCLRKRQILNKV